MPDKRVVGIHVCLVSNPDFKLFTLIIAALEAEMKQAALWSLMSNFSITNKHVEV